jgi:hypothetical protein
MESRAMTVVAARKRTAARNVGAPISFHARRYAADVPIMGAAEFRQCMEQLAWSYAYLAEALPCAPVTVRRWAMPSTIGEDRADDTVYWPLASAAATRIMAVLIPD